jgi:hypothetical protein
VDSRDYEVGNVTGLYVDRYERKLRFIQVTSPGFLGLGRRHYLVPIEEIADETRGMVQLAHDEATVKRAPEFDPHTLPTEGYQRAIREHYGVTSPA